MNFAATGNPAAAEAELRHLVSDLFHQLTQPLTIMRCSLELALLQAPSAEQYGEIVGRVLRQAEQASWLVTAIRELFDATQAGEDSQVLELRSAVEDAVSDLLPVAEAAGVQICCLPLAACPVWFDAPRLRQGLFHLLGSMVGSGERGAMVKIELNRCGAEGLLALTVSGAKKDGPSSAGSDQEHPPQELVRRLGSGIARAIFEAAGASFTWERTAKTVSVEVRFLRNLAP
ncbi:MAG: sensor histidine kinase [Terriglobales bacterium]